MYVRAKAVQKEGFAPTADGARKMAHISTKNILGSTNVPKGKTAEGQRYERVR